MGTPAQSVIDTFDELPATSCRTLKSARLRRSCVARCALISPWSLTTNSDLDTIVWKNGADMSPDFLYEIGVPVAESVPAA